jgi:hypothetical protein
LVAPLSTGAIGIASAMETPSPVIAIAKAIVVMRISAPLFYKSLAWRLEGSAGECRLNQTGHYCGENPHLRPLRTRA